MYNADYVLRIRNYAYTWYFYSPIPRPRNTRNRLKIPLSPGNDNLPFPYPPIPRGSFPVGELASLTGTTQYKSQVNILQNFVAFSEYMNLRTKLNLMFILLQEISNPLSFSLFKLPHVLYAQYGRVKHNITRTHQVEYNLKFKRG